MNEIDIGFDLNGLRVFEALYEEGGATRAALRLSLTQSAVSAALGRLRKVYGDPLFTRTGRGLAPTLRAQELRPVIGEALNKCRESLALGTSPAARYQGRSVVLGLSDDFEIAMGPWLVQLLAQHAPGLRLAFRQTHSQIVAEMLMAREIDLAITAGGLATRWLSHRSLGEGGYACVVDAPPSRRKAALGLTVEDYVARNHVLISSGGFIGVVDEVLAALGHKRRVVASTTHFAALPYLLKGTQAVATVPIHAAHAMARLCGLTVLPCPVVMPRYAVELGWRTDALRDSAVAQVQSVVAAHWGGLPLDPGA
ncbi:transcriptional regulator [Acidovorax sp. CF316]|uniref:LysR family transcriptional regulator n=1 Tax=Acidovorax sp. CF316 TaxID=1144317 RepID=UPI00026BCF7A|nr:LysR family transcriptional regulator [Acidovorax sp. CF316]EJE52586.1 transcriptional regulator [Acidovorax sp. CF316]